VQKIQNIEETSASESLQEGHTIQYSFYLKFRAEEGKTKAT
jgi:hypothetical protein